MSYSFSVRAATKAAVLALVAAKMAEVAEQQPVHKHDQAQALQVAETFVSIVPDDETREVQVTMSGYISGQWEGSEFKALSGVNVAVGVQLWNAAT